MRWSASRRTASVACMWPSSVNRASMMPGSWRVAVKCRLNSLCPWRSRIIYEEYRPVWQSATPASARELFVSRADHPYLWAVRRAKMGASSGFPIDLILFGMIAAFLVLRLRSILGRRTGFERQAPPVQPPAGPTATGPVIDGHAETAAPAATRTLPDPASPTGQALAQMRAID